MPAAKKPEPVEELPTGLWPKILYVQSHAGQIVKSGKMNQKLKSGATVKYDFMQEHNFLELLGPLWAKVGLVVMVDVERSTRSGNSVSLEGRLTVVDADTGDRVERLYPAEGTDMGDKATPKALTQLNKYALQKFWQISTEKIEDSDNDASATNPRRTAAELVIGAEDYAQLVTTLRDAQIKPDRVKGKIMQLGGVAKLDQLPVDKVADFQAWVAAELEKAAE